MSDFDDRELRDSLQRLAGHPGDETAAYAVVQQRVRVAKRRRAAAGASGLVALCIAGFVLVGFDRRSGETLTPATDGITVPTDGTTLPDVTDSTDSTDSTDVTDSTEDATTVAPTTTPEMSTSAPAVMSTPTTHAVDISVPHVNVGTIATGRGSNGSPPIATTGDDPAGQVPGTTAADPGESSDTAGDPSNTETQTFTSAHGSLTVSMRDGRLSIVGQQAEAGYTYSVERAEATRIRVRFRSGEARSQIDVSIVDGRLVGVPSEEGSSSPSTSPAAGNAAPPTTPPSSTVPSSTVPSSSAPETTDDHGGSGSETEDSTG